MDDDSLRSRLEALNRTPIPGEIREVGLVRAVGEVASASEKVGVAPTPIRISRPEHPSDKVGSPSSVARPMPGLMRRGEVVQTVAGLPAIMPKRRLCSHRCGKWSPITTCWLPSTLYHNAIDLVTLFDLALRLAG
jgi:hypothetical protein